jgi:flagellar protein FlaG
MSIVSSQTLVNTQPVQVRPTIKKVEEDGVTTPVNRQDSSAGGNPVPGVNQPKPINSEELNQAVSKLNEYVQNIQRDLEFSVDDDVGKIVIKVIDSESKELIRQIPPETVLEVAKSLKDSFEGNLLQVKA